MTAALSGADAKEDMVERVARALYALAPLQDADFDLDGRQVGGVKTYKWEGLYEFGWEESFLDQARAAIAAMREPTEAMCAAAEATGDYWYFDDSWAAMIDAALQEGK